MVEAYPLIDRAAPVNVDARSPPDIAQGQFQHFQARCRDGADGLILR